jgi:L-serine deaminase
MLGMEDPMIVSLRSARETDRAQGRHNGGVVGRLPRTESICRLHINIIIALSSIVGLPAESPRITSVAAMSRAGVHALVASRIATLPSSDAGGVRRLASIRQPLQRHALNASLRHLQVSAPVVRRQLHRSFTTSSDRKNEEYDDGEQTGTHSGADTEHAVISTFDLFSIGIGPSSSHTVGPMRAGNIFIADLVEANLLHRVNRIRVAIYGSLALTGEGHMTPSALLLGLESADVETVETDYVPTRFKKIKSTKKLWLGHGLGSDKSKEVAFDYARDFIWEWGKKLPQHSNGMRLMVFDAEGDVLATNDMFSVGGGFVVNGALSINPSTVDGAQDQGGQHPADLAENMYYKQINRSEADGDRKTGVQAITSDSGHLAIAGDAGNSTQVATSSNEMDTPQSTEKSPRGPAYPFHDAQSLVNLCHEHNLTIAQLVYQNEKSLGYTDDQIYQKLFRIWQVMDESILEAVQADPDSVLPGSLKLHRRAPSLYRRLTRGLYPTSTTQPGAARAEPSTSDRTSQASKDAAQQSATKSPALTRKQIHRAPALVHGALEHPIAPAPPRRTTFPAMDHLTVYAMAVNETNAAGGRIVTAPTNGAAGIIPAVLKYVLEFVSENPERDVPTFLLTSAAIGMLYKRGATISAAEGGCMAEVGVACSMAAGAFAACMGASPETIEQAAEIGIEHNLGLTCDPIGGLVQAPCIERNALGAIKAISSANLALSSTAGHQKVRLDDAIAAMRLTAKGMRNEFKETSLSGLATSVPIDIPVSVPEC